MKYTQGICQDRIRLEALRRYFLSHRNTIMSHLVMHSTRFSTKHNISLGPQCCGSLLRLL